MVHPEIKLARDNAVRDASLYVQKIDAHVKTICQI